MARVDNYNLVGGQNSKVSPLVIGSNECEIVKNYHMDNVGSLTKRNGIVNLVGQIVNGKPILGMFYFNDVQSGSNDSNILVAIDDSTSTNSDIFDLESDSWTISNTDDTAGALPVFASFLNYVYRTNGNEAMASSNDPPTSWGTTNCVTGINPKYCAAWEDRMYVANDTNNPYPSRLYWSSLAKYGSNLTWDTGASGQWADINPDDGDEMTWIEPFGKVMLVFKENGLYHWTFGQVEPDKIIDQGTPQGRTVKQTQGLCFFANKYGVWRHTGTSYPTLISEKVRPFIKEIPDLTKMRAEVDDDHYYLYIGDVTVNEETHSNCVLVYTISLKCWHIETYPFPIKAMARFKRETLGSTEIYNDIYIGDDDGYVYRMGTGSKDYNGTTAVPISGYIRTREELLNFPKGGEALQAYIVSRKSQGATVNYRIDRAEDFKPLIGLDKRIVSKRLAGRARTIQFSITDNSQVDGSQIEGYTMEYKDKDDIRREG